MWQQAGLVSVCVCVCASMYAYVCVRVIVCVNTYVLEGVCALAQVCKYKARRSSVHVKDNPSEISEA